MQEKLEKMLYSLQVGAKYRFLEFFYDSQGICNKLNWYSSRLAMAGPGLAGCWQGCGRLPAVARAAGAGQR